MSKLRRLWSGELSLDEAFWSYAVIGGLAVNLATTFLFLILVATDRPLLALAAGYGLSVPYNIVVLVGVWRSAERDDSDPDRAALLRAITLVGMVLLSVT